MTTQDRVLYLQLLEEIRRLKRVVNYLQSQSTSNPGIPASEKGAANGVAPLNASSKIDDSYLSTNVVLTTGTYANPTWITSLAYSKLTGTPTTISGYGITDAVRLGGNTVTSNVIIGSAAGSNHPINIVVNGATQSTFGSGFFSNNVYLNTTNGNNARIDLGTGGITGTRNIADANTLLTLNQANSGSTGDLIQGIYNSTTNLRITRFGDILSNGTARFASNTNLFGSNTISGTHTITFPSVATGFAYYNTVDQTTNYERFRMFWTGNAYNIVTENAGTGTKRIIVSNTDIEINDNTRGIILRSPDNTRYRLVVANGGVLSTTAI